MTTTARPALRKILNASVALGLALAFVAAPLPGKMDLGSAAYAQGNRPTSPGKGQGGAPAKSTTTDSTTGTTATTTEETDSDKKGPKFGGGDNTRKPASGTTGGRPVWAKEGIPAVELGRLSVARAPATVITKALNEAISNWTTVGSTVLTLAADGQPTLTMTVADLYSKSAEEFASLVMTYYPSIVRIDSPLENLGLYQAVASTGKVPLDGVKAASTIDLLAIFLGSASDKTLTITTDTVIAMNTILGLPTMSAEQVADLAAKAEDVRLAILIGHDG